MAYTNTFITIAEDCSATISEVPVPRGDKKPMHLIQYELLTDKPYTYTHEDLVFEVYVRHKAIPEADRTIELRADFLKKEHPCLRASALTKRYGWGAHYNDEGKIALYALESPEYRAFISNEDSSVKLLKAMRSKRK